ncbi:MAG: ATP-dependent sacrificial sulfur transferase LarE [candidate division Zixibacteria bacterium]|nr:ATP-dependent sacrificial sulfur transferase LarE [candidate division Zixibacteria bacterium]
MNDKESILIDIIKKLDSVVIGLSGGVDSTLTAKLCVDYLNAEKVWVVTGDSKSIMSEELEYCKELASWLELPVDHFVIINTDELDDPNYTANPENRCYYCKHELFGKLTEFAEKIGAKHVIDGSNATDLTDYRPGMQAGRELKVRAPLAEAGFTKEDIRSLAKKLGLPNWDKPAMPCLSSRIPYHSQVTPEKLDQVARAERYLRSLGFRQFRVRHHDKIARIEVEDLELFLKNGLRERIDRKLKEIGFTYVALDLGGFKSGNLNIDIKGRKFNG